MVPSTAGSWQRLPTTTLMSTFKLPSTTILPWAPYFPLLMHLNGWLHMRGLVNRGTMLTCTWLTLNWVLWERPVPLSLTLPCHLSMAQGLSLEEPYVFFLFEQLFLKFSRRHSTPTKMAFPITTRELMVPTQMSMILQTLRLTATQVCIGVGSLLNVIDMTLFQILRITWTLWSSNTLQVSEFWHNSS